MIRTAKCGDCGLTKGSCGRVCADYITELEGELQQQKAENKQLKQQLKVAEKALKELNNTPCPLDDINISFLDTTLKPCEICSIKNNYKCIGSVITQALSQMQKVGD